MGFPWQSNPSTDLFVAHDVAVASLHGKTIRLRFVLRDADLYSFRFRR